MKHFKLTENKKEVSGITLFQIELTIDCKWGKVGNKGGWIEKEENLQENAWVYGDAQVSGNAWVYGDARVYGDAWVYGDAQVYGNAQVYGDARVSGKVKINFELCSKFNFEFQAQLDKWLELEKQFEEIKDTLKDKPKTLEEMTKEELIQEIKQLKGVN